MPKWLLPTLSEILALNDPTWMTQYESSVVATDRADKTSQRRGSRLALQRVRAEREWSGAIAALSTMLRHALATATIDQPPLRSPQGFVLSGPLPVLSHADLINHLSTWSLTANPLHVTSWLPLQLLPAGEKSARLPDPPTTPALPLLPGDPLAAEQFCLVLTPWFSLVMVLGESLTGEPAFMFSFMPDVVQQAWEAVRPRILLMHSDQVEQLDDLATKFAPVAPAYATVMQFSRLLLEHLPDALDDPRSDKGDSVALKPEPAAYTHDGGPRATAASHPTNGTSSTVDTIGIDVELLQALAHEIRTPLTTIRTLTRSLLKRADLAPDVLKRLGIIDRECSEQIDRFGLIFRAVELETSPTRSDRMSLTRTSLAQVFQQCIPRWQQQASQRQLTLDVILPPKMPTVVSDPTMLDQALTSLIERFTRSLPVGSHIRVDVTVAGNQLKLQLQSEPDPKVAMEQAEDGCGSHHVYRPLLRSLGQLLMFQPETGSLSLNLAATKNLFQALGGKLIVRERPQQGEVMTVFLPLEVSSADIFEA